MDFIWKAAAMALLCMVLYHILAKKDKDIASVLTVAACCLIVIGALAYLEPIVSFLEQIQELGEFDFSFLNILLKAVGIGLLTEITALLCSDMGNSALGKTLQIAATAVILWLALPLFTELLSLMAEIMENV